VIRLPKIEMVPVARLRPAEWNPRSIQRDEFEALKRSLAADPDLLARRPILATPDGEVVAGNMRLRAAIALGWTEVPAVIEEMDAALARKRLVRDNVAAGEWEEQDLAELLYKLNQENQTLGFDGRELERLLALVAGPDLPGQDAVIDPPAEPATRPGDLFELGRHRLLCGDATREGDVARLMGGELARMVLADPPYNVGYHGGSTGVIRGRDDAYPDRRPDYEAWLASALAAAHRHSDTKAALHLWHSSSEIRAVLGALDASRWVNRSWIIWDKGSIQGGLGQVAKQYRGQYEPLLYCHKRGQTPRWHGPGNESDVWAVPGPRNSPLHPTMKPVELYERSLRNHSSLDDAVLELFMGSGTAIVGAERTRRRCFGLEVEPAYCDVILARYRSLTGVEPRLVDRAKED
jgi:DNA modification methylase